MVCVVIDIFSVDMFLFKIMKLGCVIKVWVMLICCCCLFENVCGYCSNILGFSFIWVSNLVVWFWMIEWLVLFWFIIGLLMICFMVICEFSDEYGFWNIICIWWCICLSGWVFILIICLMVLLGLWNWMLLLVGL